MKIDTEGLNKQMNSLSECLESYFYNFDAKRSEIEELNEATVEIIDSILNKDDSNLLWIVYGDKVNDLKLKIEDLKNLASDAQNAADDLRLRISEDSEVLKRD